MVSEAAREGRPPATNPYDSHPSLRARLEAIRGFRDLPAREPDPPAVNLLEDLPELERQLLAVMGNPEKASRLRALSWDDVGTLVYLPRWAAFVEKHGASLRGATATDLPTLDWAERGRVLKRSLTRALGRVPSEAQVKDGVENAVAAALGLALARRGFRVEAQPGASLRLVLGEESLELQRLRERITERPLDWARFCDQAGIAGLDLGQPVTLPAP